MMNMKKITLVIVSIIFAIIFMLIPNKASASTTLTTPLYFGVQEFRNGTTPENMAYAINNPYGNGSTTQSIVGTKIWQIVKYNSKTDFNFNTGNYYCVRARVGFSDTNKRAEYNISYDFKTEKNAIASSGNKVLQSIVNNGYYNNLLALADLLYLNGVSTEAEKTALLQTAGINEEDYTVHITDSDIEAVQQAAIWYYSNHDDELFERVFNNLGENKTSWLFYRTLQMSQEGKGYTSLSDYNKTFNDDGENVGDGKQRQEQAVLLYKYLINTANANAKLYENGTVNSRTKITLYANATEQNTQPIILIERLPEEIKEFDLALRKYITKVDGVALTGEESRVPNIDESTIKTKETATYKHKKDPVTVKKGSIVTYNLTIYNEGNKAGRATKIVDQLPTGLKFSKVTTAGFSTNYDETNNIVTITRNNNNTANLEEYKENNLKSETIEIECEVTAKPDTKNKKILTNVAWIAEEYDAIDKVTITTELGKDRDSEPSTKPSVNKDNMENYIGNSDNKTDLTDSTYYYKGEQDDDDFEKLVLEPAIFDLKLVKRIVEVNGTKVPERINNIDITNLANGTETTADYDLNKDPVTVKKGDIIKYTLRIYNEGDIDGYASEISEDIPEGLEFLWSEKKDEELEADETLTKEEKTAIKYNQGIWDFKTINNETSKVELITTDYLAKGKGAETDGDGANLIKAFDSSKEYKYKVNDANPDFKEVSVYMKVTAENSTKTIIRNEAAITGDTDSDGNPIDDRDSSTDKWVKYEDDEDYDNVVLQSFDLSLRKFIIAVSKDTSIEDTEYLKNSDGTYTRAPIVDTSKLNTTDENGKLITTATYNHTKEPVEVSKDDYVIYMLRVYNEGEIAGYASEIKDHLPENLEYVDGEFNEKYGWNVSEDGRTVTTTYLANSKIDAVSVEDITATITENGLGEEHKKYILSYKEVPIMCKVKDTAKPLEKITNIADITEYRDENKQIVTDRDSKPNNVILPVDSELPSYKDDETGEYIPGQEDDDDFEKVIVRTFDLALRKWVTQAIVIENGKETVTETGHKAEDDPEQVVKVELNRKKLNSLTVKFKYSIRVTNEGDVEGYAKEITDYIPEGLKFVAEDNSDWKDEGNNVISTRKLENTLLKPGESAEVEVLLTWINGKDNLGLKVNTAEISEDYNDRHLHDIDSTPDNKVPGEDDIDDAPVLLSVSTGQTRIYFTLGFIILITIAGGIVLIKKFVL